MNTLRKIKDVFNLDKRLLTFSDSRRIAFYITTLVSLFVLISMAFSGFFPNLSWFQWLGILCSLWLFGFVISYYLIERFIYDRIRVIYKSIQRLKVDKNMSPRQHIRATSIDDVRKEAEQWSEKYGDEIIKLHELEKYRREYIGNISHELKTPIFNIQGYITTLLDGGIDDNTINRSYLSKAEKSINRMIAIIEDLETIAQLESNQLSIKATRFDIILLAREVMESLEIKAAERNCHVYLGRDYEKPVYVQADRMRISQVFGNLLENAIKYGAKKNGKVKIGFYDMDEVILVEVTDNGPGISQQDLPRIFERFFRTDKGRSRQEGGTGLGLAIVKHIIEAHQQSVSARSSIGIGTTFSFTLKKA